jgi:hypothetical protein
MTTPPFPQKSVIAGVPAIAHSRKFFPGKEGSFGPLLRFHNKIPPYQPFVLKGLWIDSSHDGGVFLKMERSL